jgi:hypothetical protein
VVVADPESEARSGCAVTGLTVAVADVVADVFEGYEEVAVSGGLDAPEVYDNAEGYSVKTILFDVVV